MIGLGLYRVRFMLRGGCTCSFVCVHADEWQGAFMRRSAGFPVLHMFSSRTVPEGVAVSYQVHLTEHVGNMFVRGFWSGIKKRNNII